MKIDRMNIQMQGTKPQAQQFLRQLKNELDRVNVSGQSGHVRSLTVPALTLRPGESPQQLARRTASALLTVTNKAGKS